MRIPLNTCFRVRLIFLLENVYIKDFHYCWIWLQMLWLQEFPQLTLIFNSYATTNPNLQLNLEIGDSPSLRILKHPCNPRSSSPRTLLCYLRSLDPLELEKIRTNPQYPWRWKEITLFTLDPWFPTKILERNHTTIPIAL